MLITLNSEEKIAFDKKKKIISDFVDLMRKENAVCVSNRDILRLFSLREVFSLNFLHTFIKGYQTGEELEIKSIDCDMPLASYIQTSSSILSSKRIEKIKETFTIEERNEIVDFFVNECTLPKTMYYYEKVGMLENVFSIFSNLLFKDTEVTGDSLLRIIFNSNVFKENLKEVSTSRSDKDEYAMGNFVVTVLQKSKFSDISQTITELKETFEKKIIAFNQFPVIILNPNISREDRKAVLKKVFRQKDFSTYKDLLINSCGDAEVISDFIEVTITNNNRVREKNAAVAKIFKDIFVNGNIGRVFRNGKSGNSLISVLNNVELLLSTCKSYFLSPECASIFYKIAYSDVTTKKFERLTELSEFIKTTYLSGEYSDEEVVDIAYKVPDMFACFSSLFRNLEVECQQIVDAGEDNDGYRKRLVQKIRKLLIKFSGSSLYSLWRNSCEKKTEMVITYLDDPDLEDLMLDLTSHEQLFVCNRSTYSTWAGNSVMNRIEFPNEGSAKDWYNSFSSIVENIPAKFFANMHLYTTRNLQPYKGVSPSNIARKDFLFGFNTAMLKKAIETEKYSYLKEQIADDINRYSIEGIRSLLIGICNRLKKNKWTKDDDVVAYIMRKNYICDFENEDELLENMKCLTDAFHDSNFSSKISPADVLNLLDLWRETIEYCYREDTQELSEEEIELGKTTLDSFSSAASLFALVT